MTREPKETALRPGVGLALRDLEAGVRATRFPLDSAANARGAQIAHDLITQLRDYLLPRTATPNAPLLAVIGGSTGAGKSTLINSIAGADVSAASTIRPTTLWPVLLHNPADEQFFACTSGILPGLARVTGAEPVGDSPQVKLVATTAVPQGLALIDSPDIDSVSERNRNLSRQLLAAADLWLFVTTASRYADATPWKLLKDSAERGTAVAIVLDRVPSEANREVRHHLGDLLAQEGLESAPVFTVPELNLINGRIPDAAVFPLQSWVFNLGRSERARERVQNSTLRGALASVPARTRALADLADEQESLHAELRELVDTNFSHTADALARSLVGGRALRGEVLARWQDFVGAGQVFRGLEPTVARIRDRITSAVTGRRDTVEPLESAIADAVKVLVREQASDAVSGTARAWQATSAGAAIITANPSMQTISQSFDARLNELVGDWVADVNAQVRELGQSKRARARILSFGVNGVAAVLMIAVFAGIGGPSAVTPTSTAQLADKLLVTIFGEDATRDLAAHARHGLLTEAGELLRVCREPFDQALTVNDTPRRHGEALRSAATRLEQLL